MTAKGNSYLHLKLKEITLASCMILLIHVYVVQIRIWSGYSCSGIKYLYKQGNLSLSNFTVYVM